MEDIQVRKNALATIAAYLIIYLIGGTLVVYLLASLIANINNYNLTEFLSVMESSSKSNYDIYLKATFCNALGNMLVYLFMFIAVVIINRKYLFAELKKIKEHPVSLLIIILGGFAFLYGITFAINYLYDMYNIGVSTNQNAIVSYILDGNAFITFLATIIFAPLVEELVYRAAIFRAINNRVVSYVVSILFFALPHMLSTSTTPLEWFLLLIPYVFSGFMLALVYDSSKNIYASWAVHLLNNLLAFILVLV